jgi:bifunctional N-acetylglucosamine-1-phosphate-uridyltransferase/glucosamine-1-phosphate-acetyltransferase GlmU-like protein
MRISDKQSMPAINILILSAGKPNSKNAHGGYPICLTEIQGVPLLERIIKNVENISNSQFAFAFLENEAQRYHLENIATLLVPDAHCMNVPELSQGSACTALLAASQLKQEDELIIISANELVDLDLVEVVKDFRSRKLDGGLITFRSVHPRYSYVRLNEQGMVIEVAQREPISFHATAGIFWFAKTAYFVDGAKNLIRKDAHVDGNYFVAPTFNELVLQQKTIGVKEIDTSKYFPLKNDLQHSQFLEGQ